MVMSGRLLTEAYNKLPIKLWYGTEPGVSFDVDVCIQLLKASTATGDPTALQSTMLKRSNMSKTYCSCSILMMRLPRSRSTVMPSNKDIGPKSCTLNLMPKADLNPTMKLPGGPTMMMSSTYNAKTKAHLP
jgi:hypothetical protein